MYPKSKLFGLFSSLSLVSWHYGTRQCNCDEEKTNRLQFQATSTLKTFKKKKQVNLGSLVLLSGTAHNALASQVANELKVAVVRSNVSHFADGEVNISIAETIRGSDVFVLQSCAAPMSDSILELLLLISSARRAGAKHVTAVIPFFGYKHRRRGMPNSTKYNSKFLMSPGMDFAAMLQTVGVDRVISVDLQRPGQLEEACFFDNTVPLESIVTTHLMRDYFVNNIKLKGPIVVVAPNSECIAKAVKFEKKMSKHYTNSEVNLLAFIHKTSTSGHEFGDNLEILGGCDVAKLSGANVLIVDDIIDSAKTITFLSQYVKDCGATTVHVIASHGIFSGEAMKKIEDSPIDKIFITDTLPLPENASSKIIQVSVAPQLAKVIWSEHFKDEVDQVLYENELEELNE